MALHNIIWKLSSNRNFLHAYDYARCDSNYPTFKTNSSIKAYSLLGDVLT